jgi:predicted site-specific integrase-resolvase
MVRPTQLAELLGVSRSTLHRWLQEDLRLKACIFRPGFLSVQKLRDAGILTQANPVPKAQEVAHVG